MLDKWTARWTENWLNCWVQSTASSDTKSSWRPVTSKVPWGLIPRPVQFNIFIKYLDDRTECTLNKFGDDKDLGRVTDTPEVCVAIRGIQSGWRYGQPGTSLCSAKGNVKSCTWGGIILCTGTHWGLTSWKIAWQSKACCWTPSCTQFSVIQQTALGRALPAS